MVIMETVLFELSRVFIPQDRSPIPTPDLAESLKRDLSQPQTYSGDIDRLWRS